MTQEVLAVLAHDRRDAIARDFPRGPRIRLRRRLAAIAYAAAKAAAFLAVALDEEPGTLRA